MYTFREEKQHRRSMAQELRWIWSLGTFGTLRMARLSLQRRRKA